MVFYVLLAGVVLIGYLFGSIPFGLLLTKAAGLGDIRQTGSGNIGATNVLRSGKKSLAAATLLLDMAKGFVPVYLISYFDISPFAPLLAGIGALLGHIYPIWLKFKGGKGVATYIGVLAGFAWPLAVAFCLIWIATAFLTRISSLAALVASALVPVLPLVIGNYLSLLPTNTIPTTYLVGILIGLSILIFYTHRENIGRLMRGEESRIGG